MRTLESNKFFGGIGAILIILLIITLLYDYIDKVINFLLNWYIILPIIVIIGIIYYFNSKVKKYYITVPNKEYYMLSEGVCSFDASDPKEQELMFEANQRLTKKIDSIKEPIIEKHIQEYGDEVEYRFIEIEEDFQQTEKEEEKQNKYLRDGPWDP